MIETQVPASCPPPQARKTELLAFATCLDMERGCLLTRREYELGVEALVAFSAAPEKAKKARAAAAPLPLPAAA
jgi:hypothetical protein